MPLTQSWVPTGFMQKRVTIQQPAVVGGIQKFTTLITVWAHVEPVSGSEVARQLGPTTTVMSTVTIPWLGSIAVRPKMRILLGSRSLEIIQVIDVEERHIQLSLVCREVVN